MYPRSCETPPRLLEETQKDLLQKITNKNPEDLLSRGRQPLSPNPLMFVDSL